jgi:hypothetical protein
VVAAAAVSVAGKQSWLHGRNGPCSVCGEGMPKGIDQTETFLELQFKLDSISRAATPSGAEGIWHSYVISQGTNTITGIRAGTHAEVSMLLADMIERLNERRAGKKRSR